MLNFRTEMYERMKVEVSVVNKKIKTEAVDFLFDAILHLKDRSECYSFFEDLCTVNELSTSIKKVLSKDLNNAKIIRAGLESCGYTCFGGVNAPYVWLKVPEGITSWEFFDKLLNEAYVVGTPGVGFGKCGEGFFRLTAFSSKEDTEEAVRKIVGLYK